MLYYLYNNLCKPKIQILNHLSIPCNTCRPFHYQTIFYSLLLPRKPTDTMVPICLFLSAVALVVEISALQRCNNQLMHITEEEYNDVFYTIHNVLQLTRINCVMQCLKMDSTILVSVYGNELQLCACVNRRVEEVPKSEATKEVTVVDLNRPGEYVDCPQMVIQCIALLPAKMD